MGEINRHSASRHHRRVPPLHGAVMHRTLLVQVRHNCNSADVARAHIKPDEIGLNGLQISVTIKQNNDPSSISKSPCLKCILLRQAFILDTTEDVERYQVF